MEFEFDKEIDAMLRQTRHGEDAAVNQAHLDADEISAFAENRLSDTTRKRFTTHLAECARCRKILSNVVLLNSEAVGQTAFSTFPAGVVAAAPVPWYRKLFAFPQLAYGMGALALLFSGFLAYVVLQSTAEKRSATVAQKETYDAPAKDTSGGGSLQSYSTNSNSSMASNTMSNSASSANVAPSIPAAGVADTNSTANKAAPAIPEKIMPVPAPEQKTVTQSNSAATFATPLPTVAPPSSVAGSSAGNTDLARIESEKSKQADKRTAAEMNDDSVAVPRSKTAPAPKMSRAARPQPVETRTVGGKTFRRVNSAWIDGEYDAEINTQTNMVRPSGDNVARGSAEYKKLDAGLRNIVEKLDGLVIIVWKGRVYRIQ